MNDQDSLIQVLADYYKAFSTLDVQKIAPFFYEPSLLVSPQGVLASPTHEALMEGLKFIADGLRLRGYSRSEIILRSLRNLSSTDVMASGIAVRYKNEQELERVGVTYLLHKSDSGWKIAVTVIHDVEKD